MCNIEEYFYFISFSAQASQYFSTSIAPSPTRYNASLVALFPQVIQNFVFPLASLKGFNTENVFSIYCLTPNRIFRLIVIGNIAIMPFTASTMDIALLLIL